jgi:hypothetical protein
MKRLFGKCASLVCVTVLSAVLGLPLLATAQDVSIYGDGTGSGWFNWSWSTTVNMAATSPVHGGTRSMAVTYGAAWAGLYLHVDPAIDLAAYDRITFWIHGGNVGGQRLCFVANGDGGNTASVTALAQTWVQVDVPLTSLGSPATLTDLYWQDVTGGAQPTFFLDDITLVARTGPPPPPPTPGAGPTLSIDTTAGRHPVSDDIYGMNYTDEQLAADLRLPVRRWGGNSTTRYNWQADVHNTGSDWYFENIPEANSNPAALPDGSAADRFIDQDRRTLTKTIMTVPLIGWTPSRRVASHPYDCGFKVSKYGPQQSTDSWDADCGNGIHTDGTGISGNSPTDTSAAIGPEFVTSWINHLTGKYGSAGSGGVAYYNLDNEPMLWNSTHRDVHPRPVTYDEMKDRTYKYASAVKGADPTAKTLGPVLWGWCAYLYSAADGCGPGSDYANHGNTPFVPWYLQQMKGYENQYGTRILDYLDLHYYPQANGVALSSAGSGTTQALRLRSTRSLWDPTYVDESWISDTQSGGVAVQLIPRMKGWVSANYPGTKLSITEYNWGALDHINGALTQADVLGIFGREGMDVATLWGPPTSGQPGAFAFRIYRNYDGQGSGFGNISVQAASADQATLAVYASQRSTDNTLTAVVINKTTNPLTSTVKITGFTPQSAAGVFRYSTNQPGVIEYLGNLPVSSTGLDATFAAQSITLLELKSGSANDRAFVATKTGSGSGTLSSATPGVICGSAGCTGSLAAGTTAVVNATVGTGSTFGGWTGCTLSNGSQCSVLMDSDKTVSAAFSLSQYTLLVNASGTGAGSVSSTTGNVSFSYPASSSRSASIAYGTPVTLTATGIGGATTAWSGNCDSAGGSATAATCTIAAMNAGKTVSALFAAPVAAGIAVTAPNGGEIWRRSASNTISWTFTGNPGKYVRIELLKGGTPDKTIASKTSIGTNGKGSYAWLVPNKQALGSDYTVRVTSTTIGSISDTSNGAFTIAGK